MSGHPSYKVSGTTAYIHWKYCSRRWCYYSPVLPDVTAHGGGVTTAQCSLMLVPTVVGLLQPRAP